MNKLIPIIKGKTDKDAVFLKHTMDWLIMDTKSIIELNTQTMNLQ